MLEALGDLKGGCRLIKNQLSSPAGRGGGECGAGLSQNVLEEELAVKQGGQRSISGGSGRALASAPGRAIRVGSQWDWPESTFQAAQGWLLSVCRAVWVQGGDFLNTCQ